jgi:hypothetical protein
MRLVSEGLNRCKQLVKPCKNKLATFRRKMWLNCGLYYKPITIVNDGSSIINKLETSLIDDARITIYDRHMFIVQATGHVLKNFLRP